MSTYIDSYKLIVAVRTFFVKLINEAEPLMADDEEAFDLKIVNPLLEANKAIASIIREQPSADVTPVVHGKWIMLNPSLAKCSVCGGYESTNGKDKTGKGVIFKMQKKFCPNCGADMRGGTE